MFLDVLTTNMKRNDKLKLNSTDRFVTKINILNIFIKIISVPRLRRLQIISMNKEPFRI